LNNRNELEGNLRSSLKKLSKFVLLQNSWVAVAVAERRLFGATIELLEKRALECTDRTIARNQRLRRRLYGNGKCPRDLIVA